MKIASYLAQTLKKAGVDKVFGIPSYVGLGLLSELQKAGFEFILNTHEQNACHMAEGYYLANQKLPVVSLAIGPGVTNATTGIANAFIDSIPMIVLAGRAYSSKIGRNEYHANSGYGRTIDERLLIRAITKQGYFLDNKFSAIQLIYDSIRTSLSPRPGPVYLSVPPELQKEETLETKILSPVNYLAQNKTLISDVDLHRIEKQFNQAIKPLIVLGREVSKDNLTNLRKLLTGNCPYFTSYGAKGKVPLLSGYLGTLWYSNSEKIVTALEESDLVLAIGEEFTHFTTYYLGNYLKDKKIIQIVSNPEEIGRAFNLEVGLIGDVSDFVSRLDLEKKTWQPTYQEKENPDQSFNTLNIIKNLGSVAPENAVFFADVGNAGYCAITDLELKETQDFYTAGKFGTCGWSIPTSMGYALGDKTKPTFTITGDLSLNMNMQELANVKSLGIKSNFFLFNNHGPQNITSDQIKEVKTTIQSEISNVQYKNLTEAFGLKYQKINSQTELAIFMQKVDWNNEQYLVEFDLARKDDPLR